MRPGPTSLVSGSSSPTHRAWTSWRRPFPGWRRTPRRRRPPDVAPRGTETYIPRLEGQGMSTDRISRLHEQASEHYLNGDYPAALASWREVLALDPRNEAALEGARMASQFAADQAPAVAAAAASPDIEKDLDLGLKVFDSLASKAPEAPIFDLGDPSQVDAAPVLTPTEEGWEPSPSAEEVSFGLAPAPAASVEAPAAAPTAAATELRRR